MHERVLVVDDERSVRVFSVRVLDRLGYEAKSVASGEEGLELLGREHFDVLITDVMMPGMTGIELLTQARVLVPNLAVIVVTGFGTLDLATKALRAGAQDFLSKPFGTPDLEAAVEHALSQMRIAEERMRFRVLLPLFDLNRGSLQDVDIKALCSDIVEIAKNETGADGAALLLIDDARGAEHLVLQATAGQVPDALSQCAPLLADMREGDEALMVTADDAPSGEIAQHMCKAGVGSVLCTPLSAPNRSIGLLALTKKSRQDSFGKGDIEMISALAMHGATLIENALLVTKLEAWNRDLEARVEARTRELKVAQEKLLRSERLATIGKLGAGIAHELRNPLGVVSNSVYYLKSRLGDTQAKVAKHLNIIEREVGAANKIISDLMGFVRTTDVEVTPSDPANLVKHTLERSMIPPEVKVHTDLGSDLPLVLVDADKIEQVFHNLINNAVQAMSDGGDLTVRTMARNGHVSFSFEDTGEGISSENLNRIFEPLFTTKSKGIGLGLALVKLLVEAHQGEISVYSREGVGSTFTVALPYMVEEKVAVA
jgi:signal transduction histidine kinase/CheY-like chemotaxis protein